MLAARTGDSSGGIHLPQPSLAGLEQALLTAPVGEIGYLLDLCEEAAPEQFVAILRALLAHAMPEVRLDVYQRIERLALLVLLPNVRQQLQTETSPAVQAIALRFLTAHGGRSSHDELALLAPNPFILEQAGG